MDLRSAAADSTRVIVGTDEAGYGPNLGPLVVAATQWEVPDTLPIEQLPVALAEVIRTDRGQPSDSRLYLADSKQVYRSGQDFAALERGVLTCLAATQAPLPRDFRELIEILCGQIPSTFADQPWYQTLDFPLPRTGTRAEWTAAGAQLRRDLTARGIACARVSIDLICPARFNADCVRLGNKATLLTDATLGLIAKLRQTDALADRVWQVQADRHGGRKRYLGPLLHHFPEDGLRIEQERAAESAYAGERIGFCFAVGSERFLPVAVASMTAKYVRELCLELFNRYWQTRFPSLRPTKGYPVDARRFRNDLEALCSDSAEMWGVMWRDR